MGAENEGVQGRAGAARPPLGDLNCNIPAAQQQAQIEQYAECKYMLSNYEKI